MKEHVAVVILMAGTGSRFGSLLPKQFHEILGKKVYLHTLDRFRESRLFDELVLVCHPDWVVHEQGVKTVIGGATRQESSYRGLLACSPSTKYVVIHDAARPFVSLKNLQDHIELVKKYEAVNTCIPCADTIVHSVDGKRIDEIPLRSEYWRGQTPQSFAYDLILESHQRTKRKNATDDCSLVIEMGCEIAIVQADGENIKITTEIDLMIAEALMKKTEILQHQR